MQKWEYLFVSAEQSRDYVVRYINGKELPNWEKGDTIYTFANKMGGEGWELVSAPYTSSGLDWAVSRLIFKRPKPPSV
jgi:hypothetical protein